MFTQPQISAIRINLKSTRRISQPKSPPRIKKQGGCGAIYKRHLIPSLECNSPAVAGFIYKPAGFISNLLINKYNDNRLISIITTPNKYLAVTRYPIPSKLQ